LVDGKHLAQAARALQDRRLADAEHHCRGAIAGNPADAEAWHLLALVRRATGDHASSLLAIGRSVELKPRNAEARSNHAHILIANGQWEGAFAEFSAALELSGGFRPARIGLARLCNDLGLHADALAHADRLLKKDRHDVEAWSARGTALHGLGLLDDAIEAFREALTIAPDYVAARDNLIACFVRDDRPEDALREIDAASQRGTVSAATRCLQAAAFVQLDRYGDAESSFEEVLSEAPGDRAALRMLTQLRHVRGDDDFIAPLRAAASAAPAADSGLRLDLADALRRAGRAEEAESELRAVLQVAGPRPELQASLATLLHEQGRLAEALELSNAALAARPRDSATLETNVALLLSLGESQLARERVEPLLVARPTDLRWITYRIDIARQLGESQYLEWIDCDRLVQCYELQPPAGFESIEAFLEALRAVIQPRHWQARPPLDQSLRGGTQTSRGLQHDPDPLIRALLEAFQAPIAAHQQQMRAGGAVPPALRPLFEQQMRLIGAWSVRLGRGGAHVNHFHPQGLISSAFYLTVPDETRDPQRRSGWIRFGEPRWPTPGCGPVHEVQPKVGRLVLFPSWMWHGTTPLVDDAPRVTVAFDVACRAANPLP
jgi:tetratricopeptide (TPR) repeat protein